MTVTPSAAAMAALAVAALPGALAVSTAWPARVFLAWKYVYGKG
jgi:hypothetical protein